MRVWIKFSKGQELRFLSHLDLMRAWQRALRRAGLPVAYSSGFNPHQKLSFASALPVGAVSLAEYADIIFSEQVLPDGIDGLKAMLPRGLQIIAAREVPDSAQSLMALVEAAAWEVPVPADKCQKASDAIEALLRLPVLPVWREGKKGTKTIDLRPLILSLSACDSGDSGTISMLLTTSSQGGARPLEVLKELGLEETAPGLVRKDLFIKSGNHLQSPMNVLFINNEVHIDAKKDYYQL